MHIFLDCYENKHCILWTRSRVVYGGRGVYGREGLLWEGGAYVGGRSFYGRKKLLWEGGASVGGRGFYERKGPLWERSFYGREGLLWGEELLWE